MPIQNSDSNSKSKRPSAKGGPVSESGDLTPLQRYLAKQAGEANPRPPSTAPDVATPDVPAEPVGFNSAFFMARAEAFSERAKVWFSTATQALESGGPTAGRSFAGIRPPAHR